MWSTGDFGEVLHNSVNQPSAAGLASLMPSEPCESVMYRAKTRLVRYCMSITQTCGKECRIGFIGAGPIQCCLKLVSVFIFHTISRTKVPVVAAWRSGNMVGRISEVTLRRARLVLGWMTIFGR